MRMRGLEPPQDCSHSVLSAARLPFRHIRMIGRLLFKRSKNILTSAHKQCQLIFDLRSSDRPRCRECLPVTINRDLN